jgi:hypothetical protein
LEAINFMSKTYRADEWIRTRQQLRSVLSKIAIREYRGKMMAKPTL